MKYFLRITIVLSIVLLLLMAAFFANIYRNRTLLDNTGYGNEIFAYSLAFKRNATLNAPAGNLEVRVYEYVWKGKSSFTASLELQKDCQTIRVTDDPESQSEKFESTLISESTSDDGKVQKTVSKMQGKGTITDMTQLKRKFDPQTSSASTVDGVHKVRYYLIVVEDGAVGIVDSLPTQDELRNNGFIEKNCFHLEKPIPGERLQIMQIPGTQGTMGENAGIEIPIGNLGKNDPTDIKLLSLRVSPKYD